MLLWSFFQREALKPSLPFANYGSKGFNALYFYLSALYLRSCWSKSIPQTWGQQNKILGLAWSILHEINARVFSARQSNFKSSSKQTNLNQCLGFVLLYFLFGNQMERCVFAQDNLVAVALHSCIKTKSKLKIQFCSRMPTIIFCIAVHEAVQHGKMNVTVMGSNADLVSFFTVAWEWSAEKSSCHLAMAKSQTPDNT